VSTAFLLILTALISVTDRNGEIQSAVEAHYSSILAGKVVGYEISLKRCPQVKGSRFFIEGVRGDEDTPIPRGARLCWVDATVDGRTKTIPVTVKIETVERLPVAKCDIPPRTTLNDSLVEWRVMASDKLGAARFPTVDRIRGFWTKVRIPCGSIITMPRLAPIPAVAIGEGVTLVVRNGLVEVRTSGYALEDGQMGQMIKVMTTSSRKKLKGIIEAAGLVAVE